MKAFITGSTGFLGSHLVEALLKKDFSIKCLVRNSEKLKRLIPNIVENRNIEIVCGDCCDKKSLELAITPDIDYVFHLAGLVRAVHSDDLYLTNVRGTKNLVDVVFEKNPGVKRFVYISSQAASGPSQEGRVQVGLSLGCNDDHGCHCEEARRKSGRRGNLDINANTEITSPQAKKTEDKIANPVSHYGFSKFLGELEVQKYKEKLPIAILRPPSIYGPRDKDIFVFFEYAKKGFLPIPSDEKFINISYVSDIVDGIILSALSEKAKGQTYFIGDDKVFSWNDLCEILKKVVNPKTSIIKIPYFIFWISAFFSEIFARLKNKPALISFDKLNEMKQKSWLFSSAKARFDFDYASKVSLEEGIKITHNWYKKEGWL
ncbi:MAG: NAD-dependent epimerase/dehydratase family protein [Elusimicrobiota bacterium]